MLSLLFQKITHRLFFRYYAQLIASINNHFFKLSSLFQIKRLFLDEETENSARKKEILNKYSSAMFAIIYEKTNDVANTVTTQALKVLGKI